MKTHTTLHVLLCLSFLSVFHLYTSESVMFLYKVISPEQWEHSQSKADIILTKTDAAFIHFATEQQLDRVITKFWATKPYLVLKIDLRKLPGKLVLESNRPGGDEYYHLYDGSLPLQSVVEVMSTP